MSNDGWGKLPTNSDWPKKETPYDDTWGKPVVEWPNTKPLDEKVQERFSVDADGWPKPAASDGWGEFGSGTDWPSDGKIYAEVSKHNVSDEDVNASIAAKVAAEAEFAAQWTRDSLEGAHNRASVINSLRGTKDEYTIDQDGQLDNVTETVRAKKTGEPTGFYLAYSDGKWLHAILSGPYATPGNALERTEQCWKLFTDDSAFKLAFDNKFNRDGVYCAEIPLSAKRKGAYGVLT